jgi:hypothetical protein
MQESEILSGFTDLLIEFKARSGSRRIIGDLKVRFDFVDNYLILRDSQDASRSITPRRKKWSYFLTSGRPCRHVVQYFVEQSECDVVSELNEKLALCRARILI